MSVCLLRLRTYRWLATKLAPPICARTFATKNNDKPSSEGSRTSSSSTPSSSAKSKIQRLLDEVFADIRPAEQLKPKPKEEPVEIAPTPVTAPRRYVEAGGFDRMFGTVEDQKLQTSQPQKPQPTKQTIPPEEDFSMIFARPVQKATQQAKPPMAQQPDVGLPDLEAPLVLGTLERPERFDELSSDDTGDAMMDIEELEEEFSMMEQTTGNRIMRATKSLVRLLRNTASGMEAAIADSEKLENKRAKVRQKLKEISRKRIEKRLKDREARKEQRAPILAARQKEEEDVRRLQRLDFTQPFATELQRMADELKPSLPPELHSFLDMYVLGAGSNPMWTARDRYRMLHRTVHEYHHFLKWQEAQYKISEEARQYFQSQSNQPTTPRKKAPHPGEESKGAFLSHRG